MRLWLTHPRIAARDCEDCKVWVYDERTGEKALRFGEPYQRPPGAKPPCSSCAKIPLGVIPRPENATNLSEKNQRAYRHYRECRAVLKFPDHDPIVRRNAALIRQAEDEAAAQQERQWVEVMLAGVGVKRGN